MPGPLLESDFMLNQFEETLQNLNIQEWKGNGESCAYLISTELEV